MFPICFQFDYICIVKRLNKILTLRIPGFSNDLGHQWPHKSGAFIIALCQQLNYYFNSLTNKAVRS